MHRRRGLAERVLGVTLGIVGACESPQPGPAPQAAAAEARAAPAEPPTPACRDFGTLDPATLPPLPPSRFAPVLDEVWLRVLQKHYDPTLGCIDWPALRLTHAAELVDVVDTDAAYAIINRMLDALGQSHFRLIPPGGVGGDERTGPAKPPIAVRWIEERLVVVENTASVHLGAVAPGATLLAIDGETLTAAIDEIRGRARRPAELAFEIARKVEARLSCDRAGQTKKVRVTDPADGDREVIRVLTCAEAGGERITLGNLENIPTRVESWIVEGTTVGVLAFNVWMLPMVKRVEEAMTGLRSQGMTALVLDLRGNPGGVGAMSVPVARLLLSTPGSLGRLQFRDFTQDFNVEAGSNPFTGPVVILVDEGTASTSEIFAAGLRDLGRVEIVGGGPSAGAALPSVIDELTGGAILQYVVGDYRSPKGTVVEGVGVVPDIIVAETRADFAAGRDPVLDAAVEHLQQPQAAPEARED